MDASVRNSVSNYLTVSGFEGLGARFDGAWAEVRRLGMGSIGVAALRTISPPEFVRRLKHGIVTHDSKVVWFLGAGCSVSSGVADAESLTNRWLKELMYLETGQENGLEEWAEERFPAYDRHDAAAAYIQVYDALFYTEQDRQREQEALASDGQPGFGYATLAQLLTHERWGDRCNTLITTNFDDLAADALYLYSQRKPQVLTHESFDRHVQISDARPTIIKLYGDAHLSPEYLDGNRRLLRNDVKNRLRALATECTLVFVGYGGRDECILDLFEEIPMGAPSGGVYWVNDKSPGKSLRKWLEDRRAIWAVNDSFDDLMYALRQEFQLGHPSIDRFDSILQKYDEQYRAIAARKMARRSVAQPDATERAVPSNVESGTRDHAPVFSVNDKQTPHNTPPAAVPLSDHAADHLKGVQDVALWGNENDAGNIQEPVVYDLADNSPDAAAGSLSVSASVSEQSDHEILEPATPEKLINEPLIAAAVAMKARERLENAKRTGEDSLIAGGVSDRLGFDPLRDLQTDDDTLSVPWSDLNGYHSVAAVADTSIAKGTQSTDDLTSRINASDKTSQVQARGADTPVLSSGPETLTDAVTGDAIADHLAADDVTVADVVAGYSEDESDTQDPSLNTENVDAGDDNPEPEGARHKIDALIAAAVKAMATGNETQQGVQQGEDVTPVDMSTSGSFETPDLSIGALDIDAADVAPPLDSIVVQPLPDRPSDVPIRTDEADVLELTENIEETGPLTVPDRLMRREEADALDVRFRLALADNPRNATLLSDYAQFLSIGRQDHDGAEHYFNRAVDADPQNDVALRRFATFLTSVRLDHERAEDCFRLAIRANFESAETMCAYAEFLWHARGDIETAGECFQVAVDAAPRDADSLMRYATFLRLVQRNDDAAYALLKLAAASAHDDPEALVALAEFCAERRGDLEKAESALGKALELDPASPRALVAAAFFEVTHKNDTDSAEVLFKRALASDRDLTQTFLAYAGFLNKHRNDPARADEMYQKAMELDPANAVIVAGYACFRDTVLGDDEGAEDMFRKAINLDPRNATVLAQYGRFLHQSRRKPNAAQDRLHKAVAMEPRNALALSSYGLFLSVERGDHEEGERHLRRAVAAEPSNPDALGDLADFLAKRSTNHNETEELFQRALSADPENKRNLRRYARFLGEVMGNSGAAEEIYRKVLNEQPKDARALSGAAHAMFSQGRQQDGLLLLDKAFDAVMGEEPRRRSIDLLLELWFFRYCFDANLKRDALKAVVWLVKEGAKVTRINLNALVARAIADNHAEPDILKELARVISGAATLERLNKFDVA